MQQFQSCNACALRLSFLRVFCVCVCVRACTYVCVCPRACVCGDCLLKMKTNVMATDARQFRIAMKFKNRPHKHKQQQTIRVVHG